MCEPLTIAGIGVVAAGTAVGMYGRYKQGQFEQAMAENNAQVSRWQRDALLREASDEQSRVRQEAGRVAGSARTALANNNIEGTVGSAADIVKSSYVLGELDADALRARAMRQAWGLANEEQDILARGKFAKQQSYIGMFGDALGGAASGLSIYSQYKYRGG